MSQDIEKKRKRDSQAEKPRKKRQPDPSPLISIRHVPKSQQPGLLVASGPGIVVPETLQFQAYRKLGESNGAHDDVLLRSSEHPKLNLTARERDDGAPEDQMKHYVGMLDTESNELQLVEVRHVSMRRTIKAEDSRARVEEEEQESTRRDLGMEFGNKKTKKAIEQSAGNRIMSSNDQPKKKTSVARAILGMIGDNVEDAPTAESLQADTEASRPRPKYNAAAKTPQEVYTTDGVIGEDMMVILKVKPWKDAVDDDEAVEVPSRYASKRIEPLSKDDNIPKLKVIKYIVVLLKFHRQCTVRGKPAKQLPKRGELVKALEERDDVVSKLIERFTSSAKVTKWHVDLIRTTLAALTLIVDDCDTDTHDLREDLGLTATEMNKYFAEVAAKVKPPTEGERERLGLKKQEASVHGIAKLKLPLVFPKPRAVPSNRR